MKKTKKDYYMELLNINAVNENTELKNFIEHELELLNKKRTSTTLTAKQEENENIKANIMEILKASNEKMSVTEITKTLEGDYTNQKISALMVQLVKEGKATREVEKKTAKFTAA